MAKHQPEESDANSQAVVYPPLLGMDPFLFLCECVFGVMQMRDYEISHLVRLCYLAEMVKVVYHMGHNVPGTTWIPALLNRSASDLSMDKFAEFCLKVIQMDVNLHAHHGDIPMDAEPLKQNLGFDQEGVNSLEGYCSFAKKYALVFLRKAAVLLYVRFGVDFNSHISPSPELDELERLTEAMRLPSFDEMCTSLAPVAQSGWPESTSRLVRGWIDHYILHSLHPFPPKHRVAVLRAAVLGGAQPPGHLRARRIAEELRPT